VPLRNYSLTFAITLLLGCWILLLFSFLVRFDLQLCETSIAFLAFNELTFSLCLIWTATAACATVLFDLFPPVGGLAAGYQPRPQVVDSGTTTRYGGQLRYKLVSSSDK